jgi:hypothetical protein
LSYAWEAATGREGVQWVEVCPSPASRTPLSQPVSCVTNGYSSGKLRITIAARDGVVAGEKMEHDSNVLLVVDQRDVCDSIDKGVRR